MMTTEQRHARNDAYALIRMAKDKLYEANMRDEMQALDSVMAAMRRKSQVENAARIESAIE